MAISLPSQTRGEKGKKEEKRGAGREYHPQRKGEDCPAFRKAPRMCRYRHHYRRQYQG